MNSSDPQFIYVALILPTMFGVTILGEGIVKVTQRQVSGWFNLVTGAIFLCVVVGGFLYLRGGW